MQTGRKSLIGALKVRTSLILVLVFFFFMLISGALLGVLSLKMNNDALREIAADDEAISLLDEAVSRYREVQVLMGRTLSSIVINSDLANSAILSEWASEDQSGGAGALSDSSKAKIAQAEARLGQAHEIFGRFRAAAQAHLTQPQQAQQVEQIVQAYTQLLDKELPPVLEQLKAGQIEQYEKLQSENVAPAESRFEQ